MRIRFLFIALGLAACQPPSTDPRAGAAANAAPDGPMEAAPETTSEIIGGWRLTHMNGQAWPVAPPDDNPPYPITLTMGEAVLVGQSQCISFWRRYQRAGEQVTTAGYGPVAMCARSLSTEEQAFEQALSRVDRAEVQGGRLHLTGPDIDLAFAPSPLPSPPRFTGRWTLRHMNGQRPPSDAFPINLDVTHDRMRAQSQCLTFAWRYRQTGELIETFAEDAGPVCERTRSDLEQRFERLMDGLQNVTLLEDGTLVLSGPEQATLQAR